MYSISAVIPAYNEEKTIAKIICAVKAVDLIETIIVVNDGSKDNTSKIARSYDNVKVIDLQNNVGKAQAIQKAVETSQDDIILFLDADLVGLTSKHVTNLLLPMLIDDLDMTIGVFNNGRFITDLGQLVTPHLTGQRALKRWIIENIRDTDMTRFGIETAITEYANDNNLRIQEVALENLTHVMKEEKMGVIKGFKERLKMYWDILNYKYENNSRAMRK